MKWSTLTLVIAIFLMGCGGSSGSGSGNTNANNPTATTPTPPPAEVLLESIELILPFVERRIPNDTPTFLLEVVAHFDDGSQKDISKDANFSLSSLDQGTLIKFNSGATGFYPKNIGATAIVATHEGLTSKVDLEIFDYVIKYEAAANAVRLPLNAQFPYLLWAWQRMSGDSPDVNILDLIDYESLDKTVAEFRPKTDSIVFDQNRDRSIGHLTTKALGTSSLRFYINDAVFGIDVEVLPHRLITSDRTQAAFFYLWDTVVDEIGDTYFLSFEQGNLGAESYFIISQYDKSLGEWLVDERISTGQDSYFNSSRKLLLNDNVFVVTWRKSKDGVYIALINRNVDEVTVERIDTGESNSKGFIDYSKAPSTFMDKDGKIIVCWNFICRIRSTDGIWGDEQALPADVENIELTDSGNMYLVFGELDSDGNYKVRANTYLVDDKSLALIDSQLLTPPQELRGDPHSCKKIAVTLNGNMVCGFETLSYPTGAMDRGLLTVSFHPDAGWTTELHSSFSNDNHNWSNMGWDINIRENGDVLLISGEALNLYYNERYYEHGIGWRPFTRLGSSGRATPVVDRKPVAIGDEWWIYLKYFNGIMVRRGSDWETQPMYAGYEQFSTANREALIYFTDKGDMAMMWYEAWGYPRKGGGWENNSLYFLKPSL